MISYLLKEGETIKAKVLKDWDYIVNDYAYEKNQIINVTELEHFDKYAIFHDLAFDWIPKELVEIIE